MLVPAGLTTLVSSHFYFAAFRHLMSKDSIPTPSPEIVARHIDRELKLDPSRMAEEWESATPVAFCADWQGRNSDPGRDTERRVLWSQHTLYLRVRCRYRHLFVFEDTDSNGRPDHLWDRDVVEAFLQPDPSREHFYREFEVSP